jgi:hypothetical protein
MKDKDNEKGIRNKTEMKETCGRQRGTERQS